MIRRRAYQDAVTRMVQNQVSRPQGTSAPIKSAAIRTSTNLMNRNKPPPRVNAVSSSAPVVATSSTTGISRHSNSQDMINRMFYGQRKPWQPTTPWSLSTGLAPSPAPASITRAPTVVPAHSSFTGGLNASTVRTATSLTPTTPSLPVPNSTAWQVFSSITGTSTPTVPGVVINHDLPTSVPVMMPTMPILDAIKEPNPIKAAVVSASYIPDRSLSQAQIAVDDRIRYLRNKHGDYEDFMITNDIDASVSQSQTNMLLVAAVVGAGLIAATH